MNPYEAPRRRTNLEVLPTMPVASPKPQMPTIPAQQPKFQYDPRSSKELRGLSSMGVLRGGMSVSDKGQADQYLELLKKLDPNASYSGRRLDPNDSKWSELPADQFDTYDFNFDPKKVNPYGVSDIDFQFLKENDDGTWNTDDLANKEMIKMDPIWGAYTSPKNSKQRMTGGKSGQLGGIFSKYIMPAVIGLATGGAGLPLLGTAFNTAVGAGRNGGDWKSALIGGAIGAGTGLLGNMFSDPLMKFGTKYAVGNLAKMALQPGRRR